MSTLMAELRPAASPRSLLAISLPPALRLLVLAPHPDDFDAIGVTLRHLQEHGHRLSVAVALTSSGVEDAYCQPPTPQAKERLREAEQRRSCAFFGLPAEALTFLNLERDAQNDDQPFDNPANETLIAGVLRAAEPDLVFLPHGHDTNSGHRHVYRLFQGAAQSCRFAGCAFLNRDPKTITLRPDIYMPFGAEQADWKGRLLRFHDSQHQRNLNTRRHGFDDRILNVNRQFARDLGLTDPFAEVFELEVFSAAP